jgi:hypothetical protein
MPGNSDLQNKNAVNRPRKLLVIAVALVTTIAVVVLLINFSQSHSQQSKDLQNATAAARKQTPNAKVTEVKVADGFASAIVSDPKAQSQANSGNKTYFKVDGGGSMTQIASGSDFSPVDLLGFGIPLATQSKLTGRSLAQTQQDLAGTCVYRGGEAPGYIGFNGSFSPGGWEIDALTLNGIEQALTTAIRNTNIAAKPGENVICVNATSEKSNATTDKQTYISTFTLELQFITSNGTVTSHMFTFAVGPNYYRSYTLDGQKIGN